ncbi:MAG: dihydroorotate dehydrogenase [Aminobacteriaceae bacterium]|nr:dihydroorotate dehydrogenase [Synergistaceae bacterium]MDD3389764.1 dihydroorotate dehydrogenase [Synergistaceae bacterium]MDD4021598.1 dihydroorotate dehydrogenase [Synergistaceae bacterium]
MTFLPADVSVNVGGLCLGSPVVIASGVWPYEPALWEQGRLEGVGGLCTKAVSLDPREGNRGVRVWETPCGMLNSIGLQNSGVRSFLKDSLPIVRKSGLPFLVNLVMESEREVRESLSILREAVEAIPAVELNISCPNVDGDGMAWGISPESTAKAVSIVRSEWSGPLWVKLTPQSPDFQGVAKAAEGEGADALVCGNTWLGMAMDVKKKRPVFQRVVAGLSGPAVFPLALRTVWQAAGAVSIPIVGCGGVASWEDAAAMVLAGASAVEVGSGMFTDFDLPRKITDGLAHFAAVERMKSFRELVGLGRKQ